MPPAGAAGAGAATADSADECAEGAGELAGAGVAVGAGVVGVVGWLGTGLALDTVARGATPLIGVASRWWPSVRKVSVTPTTSAAATVDNAAVDRHQVRLDGMGKEFTCQRSRSIECVGGSTSPAARRAPSDALTSSNARPHSPHERTCASKAAVIGASSSPAA